MESTRADLAELVAGLCRRAALCDVPADLPAPDVESGGGVARWLAVTSGCLGIEAAPSAPLLSELEAALPALSPGIVAYGAEGEAQRYLAISRARGQRLELLDRAGRAHWLPVADVAARIVSAYAHEVEPGLRDTLAGVPLNARERERCRAALLRECLAKFRVRAAWTLRRPPGSDLRRELGAAGVLRGLALVLALHALGYALQVGAWFAIAKGAFEGTTELGWLLAWLLMLVTTVPVTMAEGSWTGRVTYRVSRVLRQRLLLGATRLEPDEIRQHGAGQLLGRVIELENFESSLLTGGFLSLVSVGELCVLPALLLRAQAGAALTGTMALVTLVVLGLALRGYTLRRAWTDERLTLTNGLVERMVGHRTRVVQGDPRSWHGPEDAQLGRYLDASRAMDGLAATSQVIAQRGVLLAGLVVLAPALTAAAGARELALALGGLLLGARSLSRLAGGALLLGDAAISYRVAGPLLRAAARIAPAGLPAIAAPLATRSKRAANETPLVVGKELAYHHGARAAAALQGVSFTIAAGDRILLEGPSGAGKSTLLSLLVGLRAPSSGVLTLGGFDRATVGQEAWRRMVGAAPQFHENYVFTGTLAFNLLLGRSWPPEPADLREAEQVCRELGLGPLLERMPGGLMQIVGESGWQLSHGERSRIFLARTLLHGAELVVLDESFAALDPESFAVAMECVQRRAATLLVIAHP